MYCKNRIPDQIMISSQSSERCSEVHKPENSPFFPLPILKCYPDDPHACWSHSARSLVTSSGHGSRHSAHMNGDNIKCPCGSSRYWTKRNQILIIKTDNLLQFVMLRKIFSGFCRSVMICNNTNAFWAEVGHHRRKQRRCSDIL